MWRDAGAAGYAREALSFPGPRAVVRADRETRAADGTRAAGTRYSATGPDPSAASAAGLPRLIRGHWSVENGLHFEKDRWRDEDRHVCRRPGPGERFTTPLSGAVSAPRALNPNRPGEPLKAQADALNWDIERATNILTDSHL